MNHDEPHARRIDQELRLPLPTSEMDDEARHEDYQESNPAHFQGAWDQQQQGPQHLQSRDECQMSNAVVMQRVKQRVVAQGEQPQAKGSVEYHEGTTDVWSEHVWTSS